ncbi:MAG: hypothetical protein ACTSWC_00925 [Promethearchaeota archaeon]
MNRDADKRIACIWRLNLVALFFRYYSYLFYSRVGQGYGVKGDITTLWLSKGHKSLEN